MMPTDLSDAAKKAAQTRKRRAAARKAVETKERNRMAKKTSVTKVTAPRGSKMKTGKAWRLISPTGRAFKATLVKRMKIGKESVAVFRVVT